MDAVIFLVIAVAMLFMKTPHTEEEQIEETIKTKVKTKLNENYYHDDDAFMEMAHLFDTMKINRC